jgi:hypothetical protein
MTLNGRLRKSSASEVPTPSESELPFKFRKADPIKKAGEEIIAGYQLIEEAWKKAEAKLALAHVPLDVKVKIRAGDIGGEEQPHGSYTQFLGYVKIKNQWRICIVTESDFFNQPETEYNYRPITECPVEERLDMFELFPKLYQEVIKVTKDFVPVIKDKVADFEKALETIDLWS